MSRYRKEFNTIGTVVALCIIMIVFAGCNKEGTEEKTSITPKSSITVSVSTPKKSELTSAKTTKETATTVAAETADKPENMADENQKMDNQIPMKQRKKN